MNWISFCYLSYLTNVFLSTSQYLKKRKKNTFHLLGTWLFFFYSARVNLNTFGITLLRQKVTQATYTSWMSSFRCQQMFAWWPQFKVIFHNVQIYSMWKYSYKIKTTTHGGNSKNLQIIKAGIYTENKNNKRPANTKQQLLLLHAPPILGQDPSCMSTSSMAMVPVVGCGPSRASTTIL